MTKKQRELLIEELIDDTIQYLLDASEDLVKNELKEDYEECLIIHSNIINFINTSSELHNDILFNNKGNVDSIINGYIKEYNFILSKLREK